MAQHGAGEGWDSLASPPSVVRVTIESDPPRRLPGARAERARALIVLTLIVAAGVAGATLVAVSSGGSATRGGERARAARVSIAQQGPRLRGAAQVAAVTEAYRFPLGCMGATLTRQALTDALHSRTGPCWRYGVFVTAVLRRVGGVWRLALEATSRSCPLVDLPASVRAELAVCRR